MSLKYRPEVDGLRAIAVVPVVLFHAGATWIPGGFVGVDIFFVISGYLITSIILREVEAGQFSFLQFYERRIRRIVPPLFVMVACTLLAATCFALPDQVVDTGKSAIATILSVSNIWFWTQSGYFSPAAEYMPLLHTWSLSVEEQFYIFFPVFVVALARLRVPLSLALSITTILAFSVGFWLSYKMPSAAYYLLPARAWELCLGAALATQSLPQVHSKRLLGLLAFAGLTLIGFGIFWIDNTMAFPGWVATIPCVGAALVIYSAHNGNAVQRLLAWKPIVFIGLISYSLYLWHWPIFTFMRMEKADLQLNFVESSIGCVFSVVLAVLSWRFVERPFRLRTSAGSMPFRRVAVGLSAAATALCIFAAVLVAFNGFESRLNERAQQLLAGSKDTDHFRRCPEGELEAACTFGIENSPVKVLVVGDSNTPVLKNALEPVAEKLGGQGVVWWHSACPLLMGAWREDDGYQTSCLSFKDRVLKRIRSYPDLELVVLVGAWSNQIGLGDDGGRYHLVDALTQKPSKSESVRTFNRSLQRTIALFDDTKPKIVILGSPPGAGFDVPRTLALAELNGVKRDEFLPAEPSHRIHDVLVKIVDEAIRDSGRTGTIYVPIIDIFCPDSTCSITQGNTPLYSDSGHLSGRGAFEFLGPELQKRLSPPTGS